MIRVVLHNSEEDELVLGPFNQGVVFNLNGDVINIANDAKIAERIVTRGHVGWFTPDVDTFDRPYMSVFIHQVPLDEQRRMAWAELNVLVMQKPHCPTVRCKEHEHCIRIDLARERVDQLGVDQSVGYSVDQDQTPGRIQEDG